MGVVRPSFCPRSPRACSRQGSTPTCATTWRRSTRSSRFPRSAAPGRQQHRRLQEPVAGRWRGGARRRDGARGRAARGHHDHPRQAVVVQRRQGWHRRCGRGLACGCHAARRGSSRSVPPDRPAASTATRPPRSNRSTPRCRTRSTTTSRSWQHRATSAQPASPAISPRASSAAASRPSRRSTCPRPIRLSSPRAARGSAPTTRRAATSARQAGDCPTGAPALSPSLRRRLQPPLRPTRYQAGLPASSDSRGVPDVASDAAPNTGMAIITSNANHGYAIRNSGGTSAAARSGQGRSHSLTNTPTETSASSTPPSTGSANQQPSLPPVHDRQQLRLVPVPPRHDHRLSRRSQLERRHRLG